MVLVREKVKVKMLTKNTNFSDCILEQNIIDF